MGYKVIESYELKDFECKVDNMLNDGYTLSGGVFSDVVHYDGTTFTRYLQAMVKGASLELSINGIRLEAVDGHLKGEWQT